MTGQRIQRSRQRGARLPDGAIVITRPGKWGNPFGVTDCLAAGAAMTKAHARKVCVEAFEDWLDGAWRTPGGPSDILRAQMLADLPELAGKTLACWCPLPAPGERDWYHGAVLLARSEALVSA